MKTRINGGIAVAALCAILAACGGDGSAPPTVLPASVTIASSARVEAGTALPFSSSIGAADGLTFRWDFGDGTIATGATPSHVFADAGSYQVTLAVANTAGDVRTTTVTVEAGHFANVAGLACTQAASAGWCTQNALVTAHAITDMFFLDAQHAWAAGNDSTLLKSSDGGATWTAIGPTGDLGSLALTQVRFRDAMHGLALSANGNALQTADGGATWTANALGGFYTSMPTITQFTATQIVLASGNGSALVSHDDGATWSSVYGLLQPSATDCWSVGGTQVLRFAGCGSGSVVALDIGTPTNGYWQLQAAAFPSATAALALGYAFSYDDYQYHAQAWASADGGTTWSSFLPTGLTVANPGSTTLRMKDALNGWLLPASGYSSQQAAWTADGGHGWTTVTYPSDILQNGYPLNVGLLGDTLWVANGDRLAFTTDRGQTWQDVVLHAEDVNAGLGYGFSLALVQANGSDLVAVANGQRWYASHDGGVTWTRLLGGDARDAGTTSAAGWFFDAHEGLFATSRGELLGTTDGGKTWTRRDYATTINGAVMLHFNAPTDGWMVLDGKLAHSADRGASWTLPLLPAAMGNTLGGASVAGMTWGDASHGWVWTNDGALFATADDGANWTRVATTSTVYSAALTGPSAGVIYSGIGVQTTADGGTTWKVQAARSVGGPFVHTVGSTVWSLGYTPSRSTDGGATWTPISLANGITMTSLAFADAQHGWAVGNNGSVIATRDGGDTWTTQAVGSDLQPLALGVADGSTAWIMTSGGQILATATGGF